MSKNSYGTIVDGDGHIMEDDDAIIERMTGTYRDIARRYGVVFPPLDHLHVGRGAVETPPKRNARGPVGPKEWLVFLEDVGIDWTVLYPTKALAYGKIVSLDYAVVACRAYNDWLSDTYVKFDPRFKGMGIVPMQDPQAAADELRRIVTKLGFLGAMLPSNGLPQPLGAKAYWPIYAEADRLGCCLAVHGGVHDRFGLDHMNMYVPVHALGHPWGLTLNCANILYNGIFEQFPRVRIAFLEGGVAWLLLLLERLHASHETHFQYIPDGVFGIREQQEPTDIIKGLIRDGRLMLGIETEELTMPFAVKKVGNTPFLYSSDFPHEVTNESCKHDLGELMESREITEDDKTALLHRNAERFYRLTSA